MKKLKIFLGAYVNFPNAQNINCDNIAKLLDKEKFEIHTMYTDRMPIDKTEYEKQGIHLHRLIHHRFIWWWCKYLTMLFGKYDIYYLPKMEPMDVFFAKRHPERLFLASVEGVVGEQIPDDDSFSRKYFNNYMDSYFCISQCICDSVKKFWKKETEVLYLGINAAKDSHVKKEAVHKIVWIGSVIERKRPHWFLKCAMAFPELDFIMIGDGDKQAEIENIIQSENIENVKCLGRISNDRVYHELKEMDLLLMTSDREGLPKVIGEAMMHAVPAIYVNECYDVDYVQNGVNGFAVSDLTEMIDKIRYLIRNPEKYQQLSENAYHTILAYTWDNLIEKYENYFIEQYRNHTLKG